MTPEQQRALAISRARAAAAAANGGRGGRVAAPQAETPAPAPEKQIINPMTGIPFRDNIDPMTGQPREQSGMKVTTAAPALVQGLSMGWGDEIAGGLRAPVRALRDGVGLGEAYETERDISRERLRAAREDSPLGTALIEAGGSVVPGLAGGLGRLASGGTSLLGRVAGGAAEGALFGGIYGAGASDGETYDEVARDAGQDVLLGGALGGAIPLAARAARKVISPNAGINSERARNVEVLRREGITPTAGQATGNRNLQFMEAELGGSTSANMMQAQQEAYTRAAFRRLGRDDISRASPEIMDDLAREVGQRFDDVAARNALVTDTEFANDLGAIAQRYGSMTPDTERVSYVTDILNEFYNSKGISGEAYQKARTALNERAKGFRPGSTAADAITDLRISLDNAMERSIAANNPADLSKWGQARKDYQALLTLEGAVSRRGAATAEGIISPGALRSGAEATYGKRSMIRGQNPFAELSRAGENAMAPLPTSGTGERLKAQAVGSIPAMIGAGGGAAAGGPLGAIAGAAAGALFPRAVGETILSGPGRTYLQNQAATMSLKTRKDLVGLMLGQVVGASARRD